MADRRVNATSNVNLKAELLQTRQEYLAQKDSTPRIPTFKKRPLLQKKETPAVTEDAGVLANVTASLNEKAAKYKKLAADPLSAYKTREEALDSDLDIMVDFMLKPDAGKDAEADVCSSDEWVETVDEFGRTRLVRRSLVPDEEAEQTSRGDSVEIRTRAVGHFQFAKDAASRAQQMQELQELRLGTLESRTRYMILKQQKQLQLEQRLAAAAERKRRLGHRESS